MVQEGAHLIQEKEADTGGGALCKGSQQGGTIKGNS